MARPKAEQKSVVDARGRILVPLGGADYALRPSWEAIEAIEEMLGRSLIELSGEATSGRLSVRDMAVIVAEMLKAEGRADEKAGPSYSGAKAANIAKLIYEAGAPSVTARIAVVLVGAVTGGYTAAGEPKPATI